MEDELKKLISYANDPRLATFDEVRETNAVLRNILSKISGINLNDIEPVNGVDGEKGDQGEKGDKGEPGKDGKDGKNGRDGRDGRDGLDGKDGVDGLNGKDGKDGSPDTGEQIVDKINELPTDDDAKKIGIEHIEGLSDALKKAGKGSQTIVTAATTRITGGTNVTVTSDGNGGYIISSTGSGGFSLLTATGTVDGSNTSFTFATAPSVIVVDQGRMMQKVSSDGTVNWTGTTSVSLAVAPQNDIYGL